MGKCLSIFQRNVVMDAEEPPPVLHHIKRVTQRELSYILQRHLGQPQTHYGDGYYNLLDGSDVRRFLRKSLSRELNRISEHADSADFSWVVLGRQREWYLRAHSGKARTAGAAFGVAWGDIRSDPNQTSPCYHTCNFFVDINENLCLVEPRDGRIHPLYDNSTVTMVTL